MDTKKKSKNEKRKTKNDFPFLGILNWYQKNGRHDLPWRKIYEKPLKERLYKVWIAEVMLQQTQVERVVGYYNRFLLKYPTIESLAKTTYDELFPYYQGLGYYGRARRMIELAKNVVEKYNGVFPDEFEKLRKLPGIGQYTAQALLTFGYDRSVLAMDANLVKIFARYYFGNRSEPLPKKLMENLEKQLKNIHHGSLKIEVGRSINNALMDFGALVSTTYDKVDKENYPLRDCVWFTTEGIHEPVKKKVIRRSEKGAKLVVFVHEGHKVYWSSASTHFEPFLIEPTSSDDRRTVQDYFSATFGLEVSVRPSFGSGNLIEKTFLSVVDTKRKKVFRGTTVGASGKQKKEDKTGERVSVPLNSFGTFGNKSTNDPRNGTYDQPVKLFHAQIQTGSLNQKTFSKKEKEEWIKKYISN